ncbi:MAG TPA: efflux transporter periplasmic adaptor subunit [Alphaproteobacteria bacterium]|nr:efflux transporter periplasmic adaptor subunit [Alphaproteobacteria bacterium]
MVVLGLVIAAGAYTYVRLQEAPAAGNGRQGGGGGGGRPTYVVAVNPQMAEFAVRIDAVGSAKARESITVTAKTADTVSQVNFADGQSVPKGFVIAEMTSSQQGAQLAEARANLVEAEQQMTRAEALAASGNLSGSVLDERRAARDTAQARVRAQESQVSDRLIRAPFAGVLGLRQVSPGTLVRPGDVITTLDDVSLIKLDLMVPETAVALLKTGMLVEVKSAAFGARLFPGNVTGIDSRVDPVARTILVRVEVPNDEGLIKPGMLLSASLRADPRNGLSVPEEAIVPLADKRFVFVVRQGEKGMIAERRPVRTGRRVAGSVEILDGLVQGDQVVTQGVVKLRPDAPITLTPPRGERGARGAGA